jgi:hypothetical protein
MADQTVALSTLQPKVFGTAGFVKYAVATIASGSSAQCFLPPWAGDIASVQVMNSVQVAIPPASYSFSISLQTQNTITKVITAASIILTCGSGTIPTGSLIAAMVVLQ